MMLVIHGRLPGCNDYTYACRSNAYAGASMKKKAQKQIGDAIRQQMPNEHYEGAVTLKFRWYEKNKRRDLDGICFAKKFVLDSLQECGVIDQDNWRGVVGFTDEFFIDKFNPRIEVDIIPIIPFSEPIDNPFDEIPPATHQNAILRDFIEWLVKCTPNDGIDLISANDVIRNYNEYKEKNDVEVS